jgi:DNA-binding transcriptional LysR family regulator
MQVSVGSRNLRVSDPGRANAQFRCLHALDESIMNLIWLEDFLALAATGSFSRAADVRHSSQPAFSRRIRALEDWVGSDLFDRSTQPARLTETGEWFRSVAQDLLTRVARIPEDARLVSEESSITLRLACTHALSLTFLPTWLRGLESGLTLGPIQLMSDVLQRCEALMQQGRVQFVLSHAHPGAQGPLDGDLYLGVEIGNDVLLPVSVPDDRGDARYPLGVDERLATPILRYSDESGLGRIVQAVLGRRLAACATHTVFTAHLASVLRSMVLDGRGVGWLPRTLVADDLEAGRLVPAASSEWSVPMAIKLFRERDSLGRAAESFWQSAARAHRVAPDRSNG